MRISDWSSDVCSSDLHAALTEPATADAGAVIGRQRNLETAVAVQQRRVVAIALERFGRDHEIRHLGAVLGGGAMLPDRQTTSTEECRQLIECACRAADADRGQAGRGGEVGAGQEILVDSIGTATA